MSKIIAIYQVLLPYRVGVYERLSMDPKYDFELLYGKSSKGTKKINFSGKLNFKNSKLRCFYIPFKTNNGKSTLQITPFLFISLMMRKPDIILCEGTSNLFNSSIAFIYSKLFNKKFIWWSLGTLYQREYVGLRKYVQRWIDFVEKRSDAIFTYSTQGANYFFERGIPREKVFKGINVIDTNKRIRDISLLGKLEKMPGFNIVFVGAITKEKRLKLLCDAFELLHQKYKDIKLHIIGDGIHLDFMKQYVRGDSCRNVVFYGKIQDGLSLLLSRCHVLVLPGLGGLAISEGMVHSLPVISGIADGTELDLIKEDSGFVTRHMTVDFLVSKLEFLYNNRNILDEMSFNAFRHITSECSIDNYMSNLFNSISYVENKK